MAIDNLYSELSERNCITIIGPRGCGKSSALYAAINRLMTKKDFEIIPCTDPSAILNCFRTNCNQIFVFDNVCEKTATVVSFLNEWSKIAVQIEKRIQETDNKNRKKIVVAVDYISFRRMEKKIFSSFWYEFDMLLEGNKLTEKDAIYIANIHGISDNTLYEYRKDIFFYPELCRRYGSCLGKGHRVHIESLLYEIIDDYLKERIKDDKIFLAAMSCFVIYGKKFKCHTLNEKDVAHMSSVLRLSTNSLSTRLISRTHHQMSSSNIYIKYHDCHYLVINDEIFMGIVSFFYHNYFDLILEMSNDERLSTLLQEWKTHIEDGKIKLPHREKKYFTNYFKYLSDGVEIYRQRDT